MELRDLFVQGCPRADIRSRTLPLHESVTSDMIRIRLVYLEGVRA
jgi:hypothetical protein